MNRTRYFTFTLLLAALALTACGPAALQVALADLPIPAMPADVLAGPALDGASAAESIQRAQAAYAARWSGVASTYLQEAGSDRLSASAGAPQQSVSSGTHLFEETDGPSAVVYQAGEDVCPPFVPNGVLALGSDRRPC